jgi:hypothetical protein
MPYLNIQTNADIEFSDPERSMWGWSGGTF